MKLEEWLRNATQRLNDAGITSSRLDVLVLLEDALNTNRTQILAHPETVLTDVQLSELDAKVARRAQHIPLAYLRGHVEFYGRDFLVNEHVLVPRPESETMIELLLQLKLKQHIKLADVGTGSGVLGITAALVLGLEHVYLTDIDASALELAGRNAKRHKVPVKLAQKNLINDYNEVFDVLLCNLPYVPNEGPINKAAGHEPSLALFGGPDGLDVYRELFLQLVNQPHDMAKFVLTESLPHQHTELTRIAKTAGFEQTKHQDFIQVFEPVAP
jgi:release factor glutamine methyltransferase